MNKWKRAWRRARIRTLAEREGNSPAVARALADALYPPDGSPRKAVLFDQDAGTDPAPTVRPFDPNGPYL